jgi:CelD/BcsL family acetyltransferase involved in cellulose biosynthesis
MLRLFPRLSHQRTFAPTFYFKPNVVRRPGIGNFNRFRGFTTSSRSNQRRNRYQRFGDAFDSAEQGTSYLLSFWNRFTTAQRVLIIGIGGGAPIFYVTHLETVPQTGRRRFIFMSKSMEAKLGEMVFVRK